MARLTAELCGLNIDLGVKDEYGILQSRASREAFLSQPDKAVLFHFTPCHASWIYQIEIWFGILARKGIRRGNFTSPAALRTRIMDFIDYFNATLAKPFKWTCQGKPLVA